MPSSSERPPFLVASSDVPEQPGGKYPHSEEVLSFGRPIGRAAGLLRIGLHVERLPPGQREAGWRGASGPV